MIDRIVGFAIKQRVAVVILTLFLLAFGVWQASKLPIDAEPDVTNTQVVVSALDPALGPQELEKRVTFPLELALAGMPHLEHMESASQYGLSQVRCYFDEQVDLYSARDEVTARLQGVQGQLPSGINATMLPDTTGTGEIVHIRIAGGPMTLMQRRSYADWTLMPQLCKSKGSPMSTCWAAKSGSGRCRRTRKSSPCAACLSPMWTRRCPPTTPTSAGRSSIRARSSASCAASALCGASTTSGRSWSEPRMAFPVTLAQVATVQEGAAPTQGSATSDGQGEAVLVLPLLRVGANTQTAMQGVDAKLATLSKDLPPGTHFIKEFDRTALTQDTLHTVIHNLVEGGVLVVAILFLFLLQMRAGLIVSAIIPLSMTVAIIGMSIFHISANLMSLGAIDFGMIVDGAVIIVENSVRRLAAEGQDDKKELSGDERHKINPAVSVGSADTERLGHHHHPGNLPARFDFNVH